MSVSGIILAAGAARRMGRPKQLLPLGGRPLLQHVLDAALASRLGELILLLGHAAEEIRAALVWPEGARLTIVVNSDWAQGASSSLRLGLQHCAVDSQAAAILLGDQPGVGTQQIDRMLDAFLAAGAPAVRPVYCAPDGTPQPGHPVVLARRIWPAAGVLRGDVGALQLFAEHPDWLVNVPVSGEPPPDIDLPEDYQRLVDARH